MKDYDRVIADFQIKVNRQAIDNEKYLSGLYEKILVWIVGLSTGSIALLFSNADKIISLTPFAVNVTLTLFTATIFFGVIGRALDAFTSRTTLKSMDMFLMEMQMMSSFDKYRIIHGDEKVRDMILIIKEDFDIDISHEIEELKNEIIDITDEKLDEIIRGYYTHFAEVSEKEIDRVQKKVVSSFKRHNGYSDNEWEVERQKKNLSRKQTKLLTRCYNFMYLISIFSFVSAIIAAVVSYIRY